MSLPAVSVILPVYKQANFIRRAIDSLCAQTLPDWELWIVDDGSPDEIESAVKPYLSDPRVYYHRLEQNIGLGAALNRGIELSSAPYIAYLPADDLYHGGHLASLLGCLEQEPAAVAAVSGVRHHYNRKAEGQIPGFPLQLIQVLHRRVALYWMERSELVTDDLDRMFWSKLLALGPVVETGQVTCEWVDHPQQRHKILREPVGGINPYRQYYGVKEPLRFHTTVGNPIDEVKQYERYRSRPDTPRATDGLKILLVGELAYNADRVLALEERGHKLYGLWMPEPYWYNAVGPLAFGHVEDLPRNGWQQVLREIEPDVIYGLLNWQAVPFANQVLQESQGIPFVWHFKEGPFICLEKGTWPELVELHRRSNGLIYCSPEMMDWFDTAIPGSVVPERSLLLDGDLPKRDWFQVEPAPLLSEQDGELHTVVPGRPIGLHPHTVAELAEQRIHLHFYGDFTHGQWLEWIEKTMRMAPGYIHLHHQVDQSGWVTEFSQYDAGWLHFFQSENEGDIRRANWDDLNYPARIATLAVAGLPMLQRDNCGHIVATQTLAQQMDLGVFFQDMQDLREQLSDRSRMQHIRKSVWNQRELFMFDTHVDRLVSFFRKIVSLNQASNP